MTYLQDRTQQTSTEELFEASMTGPFGGVQSELPLTEIEPFGFFDINNFILKKGVALVRPGYTALPPMPGGNEVIKAIPSFYNASGQLIQCVITPTRLLQWTSGGWVVITGPAFSASTNFFSWDVLNYKLQFSQGVDKIFQWDGIAGAYTQNAAAPPAQYMAEIGLHLVAVNAAAFPQRYYWSAIGDPTDWSSFSAGLNDVVNNLGPIQGLHKIGQFGYGFHKEGIIQIVPTGIGTAPFAFYQMVNHFPGLYAPWSLSGYVDKGQEYAVYLSTDNVNVFNGTSIETIGDMPMAGDRRRLGARSRILADVLATDPTKVYGFVTYSVGGQVYKAYWLIVPNQAIWLFNFDEGNWTRFTYGSAPISIGYEFTKFAGIRIMDLVGTIAGQTWTPAGLAATQNLPGVLLGFGDATNGFVDFTNYSEQPASITSGKLIFGDRRHSHTVKKFRLAFVDLGSATFTIKLTNQQGQFQTFPFTVGTGTGDVLNYIQEFNLPGLRFQYIISVPALTPTAIVELAPMFQVGGEQRGGLVEN